MIFGFFDRKNKAKAKRIYDVLAPLSRQEVFYTEMGVPDTLDGRYEMRCLVVALTIIRLNQLGGEGRTLGQRVFDVMFKATELSLREVGVGDLSVPKHMRRMMQGFNGRIITLDEALQSDQSEKKLENHLRRNLYSTADTINDEHVQLMVRFVKDYHQQLATRTMDDFAKADIPT